MNARDEVLRRVRTALGPDPRAPAAPRGYRTTGEHPPGHPALLDLLTDRLLDYKAAVLRTDETGLRAGVAEALAASGVTGATGATGATGQVLVPPGLPTDWAPQGRVDDGSIPARELDTFAAVVTAAAVACAETGTIVLDGSPDQGRRAITLVPDVHVCVVRAEQVVHTVPELLARLDARRPLTFISGPSATSDIELRRVEGVHGPRTLHVVLVE